MSHLSHFDLAIQMAKEAGAYQLSQLGKAHHVHYKGEIDLVTEVDKACEEMITQKIHQHFPDHDILSEEGGGERKHSDYKWIIDPLDGTTNFAHGYPLFCVSIALEYQGDIILGVVYEPNHDELFYAQKGGGSFCNDKKIVVSQTPGLKKSLLATGFAYNINKTKNNNLNHFNQIILKSQAVRRDGVAAVDLCYVACGRYDGFWELNLFPWDVAAGTLIVREARGVVTNFKNQEFSIYEKEIVASNSLVHQAMIDVLNK